MLSGFIADGQLIYLTWVAIAPLGAGMAMKLGQGGSLLHVFLRNEILYFIVIIGANMITFAIEIVFFVDPAPAKDYTYIAVFTGMLPSIVISQFLLELQATDNKARAGGSQCSNTNSCISSVVFDRVVGSIGRASLTMAENEDEAPEDFVQEVLREPSSGDDESGGR